MVYRGSLRKTARPSFRTVGALLLGIALTGCAEPSPFVVKIDVFLTSGSNVLVPGQSLQLNASARFSNDRTDDVTRTAQWRSENERVAVVANGLVIAVSEGTTNIVASFEGATGMMSIHVRATSGQ